MTLRAPVFIVGQARSGSSILYRLIQEHPSFRPKDELNLSESHMMWVIADQPSIDVHSMRAFSGLDDDGWRALEAELRPIERRRQVAVRLHTGVLRRSPAIWAALGCKATLRTYLWHAAAARGVDRLVEKTPQHLLWVNHLLHAYPDARVVVISRHPVTSFASFQRRSSEDPEGEWAAISVDEFVRRWRNDVSLIEAHLQRHGANFRVERYEHLVADPERFQRSLFAWLGEEPRAELPDRVPANPNAPVSDAAELFGAIRDIGHDWSTNVSGDDAARIERELAAPMATLGYGSVTDRASGR